MRQFTTNNKISISFYPFGFSITDFKTGIPLMRYESISDLFPIPNFTSFTSLPSGIWLNHHGHPNSSVLQSFRRNKFIVSEHLNSKTIYDS